MARIRACSEFDTVRRQAPIPRVAEGRSSLKALNPSGTVESGDIDRLGRFTDEDIRRDAGRGGGEVRTWIAAAGAMTSATGHFEAVIDYSRPVEQWMTGMAIAHAVRGIDAIA